MNEIIERLGGIGAGTALVTAGYYIWIIGGYLNPYLMVLQWTMTISGAVIMLKALSSDHFLANMVFEGRPGIALGAATLAVATVITAIQQGWSQPGFMLVEAFLFSLGLIILINSLTSTPVLDSEPNVRIAALVGFLAVTFIFAYYAFTNFPGSPIYLAFVVTGVAGIVFRKRLMPILLIAMIAGFAVLLMSSVPALSTDELALDSYAAHLVLSGINPYLPGVMKSAFSYYHLSLFYETPISTGGYVSWLSYPALSFLTFVPALVMRIQPRILLVVLTVVFLIAIYLKYRGFGWVSILPILIALVDVNLIYYPVGSVPDVVWAIFLGLSLATVGHTKLSGALYGLSLADKQIPFIVAPYLLYMLYRDKGSKDTAIYAATAAIAFFAANAPFILLSPRAWFSAMLAPETNSLVGIGQGPGMVSFLGYYQLSSRYFTLMELFMAVMLLLLYIKEYPRYKYSFIAFPIIIFFFNYRFLFNYVIYWPVIALLVLPSTLKSVDRKARRWVNRNETAIAIAMLAVPLITAPAFHVQSSARINSVGGFANPLELPGYVTMMNVNVTNSNTSELQFRIFTQGQMVSVNGLLWNAVNVTRGKGWSVYTIEPLDPQEALQQGVGSVLEAYSRSEQAFIDIGPVHLASPLMENPEFVEVAGQIPGWSFVPNTQGGSASFMAVAGGVELSANKVRQGWAASQLEQQVNLSALNNCTLFYQISTNSYSNVTGNGNPDVAIGIQIDSGNYEVWYLYSNEQGVYRPNPHTVVILSSSTAISFSQAVSIMKSMGWSEQPTGTLMLIVGSQYTNGNCTATFRLNQLYRPPYT